MPSATISIAATGDDGIAQRSQNAYPPGGSTTVVTNGIELQPTRTLSGSTYSVRVALLRFDTSVIPDGATVIDATLRVVSRSSWADTDGRNATGEWYDPGTIDATDYTATSSASAFTEDLTTLPHAGGSIDIPLTDAAANINLTGFTGLRLHVDGGQPTGANSWAIAAWDHTSQTEPQLIVNYTVPSLAEAWGGVPV